MDHGDRDRRGTEKGAWIQGERSSLAYGHALTSTVRSKREKSIDVSLTFKNRSISLNQLTSVLFSVGKGRLGWL